MDIIGINSKLKALDTDFEILRQEHTRMAFYFLIGKKNYIQKTARCKIAPAKQKYKNEKKAKA